MNIIILYLFTIVFLFFGALLFFRGESFESIRSLISLTQTLLIAIFSYLGFKKLKDGQKSFVIFGLVAYLGGFISTLIYRLIFFTDMRLESTDFKNSAIFGVPLIILIVFWYLRKSYDNP